MHRTGLDAGETRFALLQLVRDQIGQQVWPVHRLDKGHQRRAAVRARRRHRARHGAGFRARRGHAQDLPRGGARLATRSGQIDHPLKKRMPDDMRTEREEIQDALTGYRLLQRYELPLAQAISRARAARWSSCSPSPAAGTSCCAGMKHVAHPIIGDATHGKGPLNRALAELLGLQRLWLHACRLELAHPVTRPAAGDRSRPGAEWSRWTLAAGGSPDPSGCPSRPVQGATP